MDTADAMTDPRPRVTNRIGNAQHTSVVRADTSPITLLIRSTRILASPGATPAQQQGNRNGVSPRRSGPAGLRPPGPIAASDGLPDVTAGDNQIGQAGVQRRMTSRTIPRLVTPFVLTLAVIAAPAAQDPAQNAADAERVIKALDLGPGTVVAELGAGEGELTVLVAKAIGETGRIFSNEVNPERVQQISRTVAREGLKNVTVVTGEGKSANDKGQ